MPFTGSYYCTSFIIGLFNGVHNFGANTFRVALYTTAATMNETATAYTTTNELPTAGGYTAGGAAVTATISTASTANGTVVIVTFSQPSWTGAIASCRGAMLYDDTAAGNPAVAIMDFGLTVSNVSGPFPASGTFFPAATANAAFMVLQTVLNVPG